MAGEHRNAWSRSAAVRLPEEEAHMIVGRCVWGETDDDSDTVEIYRVFNAPVFGPLLLDEPVAVLQETIAQQALNALTLYADDKDCVDEIRIGPTLNSVMIGSKPLK